MEKSGILGLFAKVAIIAAATPVFAASWKVTALDPAHLAVQCDRTDDEVASFALTAAEKALSLAKPRRTFELAAQRLAKERAPFEKTLEGEGWKVGGAPVAAHSFWKKPNGLLRLPYRDGKLRHTREARLLYTVFLELREPLAPGTTAPVSVPGGPTLDFVYNPDEPSPLFKVNQAGYSAAAGRRYAYLGGWLAGMGAWKPPRDVQFDLVDDVSGEVALSGRAGTRPADPKREGTAFCGEETLEMDISAAEPGRYFLRVPGVGRSETFEIGGTGPADAFALHMLGLFHQRCGCEKPSSITAWTDRACHLEVVRGEQPPGQWEYGSRFSGENGLPVKTGHFSVIGASIGDWGEKLRLPGGWHDAADYDRRPQHLRIVGDLAAVYLMRPDNFSDSQLAVPERGNGIPDILDEAMWGVRHLLASQRRDGGVGTWIEGTRHPNEEDGAMPSADPVQYALSRPTRASSAEFAGYAALLARAMRRAGSPEALDAAQRLQSAAERAWNHARSARPAVNVPMKAKEGKKTIRVFYDEDEAPPPPEAIAKAAVNLYALTEDAKYAAALDDIDGPLQASVSKNSWAWSPLALAEFGFTEVPGAAFSKLRTFWKNRAMREADSWMKLEEESYPYRLPWHGADGGHVHAMSWGQVHPLRQALRFVVAHYLTGERKYLDAAYLAADYHDGCNPNGSTWTSGLGRVYPVSYLSLVSCADGIAEYVPGITPYRLVFGMPGAVQEKVWSGDKARWSAEPYLRRWANMEQETVAASEFTVWETIAPAAAATGYLLQPGDMPSERRREPARDIKELPGCWALP